MEFVHISSLADIPLEPFDDRNFRRGFHHAIITAIDLAEGLKEDKKSLNDFIKVLIRYENKDVFKWRFREDDAEMIIPPVPRRKV